MNTKRILVSILALAMILGVIFALSSCGFLSGLLGGGSTTPECEHRWREATCTEAKTCTLCHKTEGRPTGHSIVKDKAVEPTCEKSGLTAGEHCSVCDEVLVPQDKIPAKGHSYTESVTEPTCTAGGFTTYTCSTCGDSYIGNHVEEKGHAYEKTVVEATCLAGGYTKYKCSVCGDAYEGDHTGIGSHTPEVIKGKAPTCTETGLTEGSRCTLCKEVLKEQEEIPTSAHVITVLSGKPATCTEDGISEGQYCSVCKTTLVEQTVIKAEGHSYGSWTAHKEATCTAEGEERETCSACGHYNSRVTDALGHNFDAVVTEPDCIKGGFTTYTCKECGHTQRGDETEPKGHTLTQHEAKDPTCTEFGWAAYETCSDCSHTTYAKINALGHNTVTDPAVAPTCTSTGLTAGSHCDRCGTVFVEQTELPVADHTYGGWYTATEPTCTEAGLEKRDCAVCGHSDERATEPTGHSYVITVVDPTCTESGHTVHTCACGDTYNTDEVAALGHTGGVATCTSLAVCDVCGEGYGSLADHDWIAANCTEAKHCDDCGKTEGDPLGHSGGTATCTSLAICSVCNEHYGQFADHQWVDANCTLAKHCANCDKAEGDPLGHSGGEATCTSLAICDACGERYGSLADHVWVDASCTLAKHCANCDKAEGDPLGHSGGSATCTSLATCDICGEKYGTLAAHNYNEKNTSTIYRSTPATCTEAAVYFYSCSCGEKGSETFTDGDPLGHRYGQWISNGDGTHTHTCTADGCTDSENADCHGGAATCTSAAICSDCKEYYGEALGHDLDDGVVTTPAGCTTTGINTYTCQRCSYTETEIISAAGHNYTEKVTAPSCLTNGYTTYTCESCGHSYKANEQDALGHDWSIEAPTCVDNQVCKTCGHTNYAIGHAHMLVGSDPATCNSPRIDYYECDRCDDGYSQEIGTATAHNIAGQVATLVAKEGAKCTYIEHYTCPDCDETVIGDELIKHDSYTATITTHATCSSEGLKTLTCTECGYSTEEIIPVNENGHNWVEVEPTLEYRNYVCSHNAEHTKSVYDASAESSATVNSDKLAGGELALGGANMDFSGIAGSDALSGKDVTIGAGTLTDDDKANLGIGSGDLANVGDNPIYNFTVSDGNTNIAVFDGFVTITIPYTLKEGEDVDSIVVWYIDGTTLTSIPATYNNGYITFKTNHFSLYTVGNLNPAEICATYGHHYSSAEILVDPTCTASGYTLKYCLRCGASDKLNKTAALGHQYSGFMSADGATCTEPGYLNYSCGRCSHSYTETIPALGHDYQHQSTVDATCEREGVVTHKCSRCDSKTETHSPQKKHEYDVTVVAPTCETSGYTRHTCSACGEHYDDDFRSPIDHDYEWEWEWNDDHSIIILTFTCKHEGCQHHHAPHSESLKPDHREFDGDCKTPGGKRYDFSFSFGGKKYEHSWEERDNAPKDFGHEENYRFDSTHHWYKCNCCDDRKEEAEHEFGQWRVTKIATCSQEGELSRSCECGYTETKVVEKTENHTYSEKDIHRDGDTHWFECAHCHERIGEEEHSWDNGTVIKNANCSETGTILYTCSCGERYTEEIATNDNHNYSRNLSSDENGHWYECTICHDHKDEVTHEYGEWRVVTTPTCSDAGLRTQRCDCGHTVREEIPATGNHRKTNKGLVSDDSEHWYECADCGEEFDREAHNVASEKVTKKPTCSTEGTKTVKCSCGHVTTESIPATGEHDYHKNLRRDDDSHWYECRVCGEHTEHIAHSYDIEIHTKLPTCDKDGFRIGHCECNHSQKLILPATGEHDYSVIKSDENEHWTECSECHTRANAEAHTYDVENGTVVKAPTCVEAGIMNASCSCGRTTLVEIAPTGEHIHTDDHLSFSEDGHWYLCDICGSPCDEAEHSFDDGRETLAPTCAEEGVMTYICNCGYSYNEAIAPTGEHIFNSYGYDEGHHWYVCTVCGTENERELHSFSEYTVTKPASCAEEGELKCSCACGHYILEAIPVTENHTFGSVDYDGNGHWNICSECDRTYGYKKHVHTEENIIKDATCVAPGEKTVTCSCGHSETREIAPTGEHTYDGNYCTECGQSKIDCDHTEINRVEIKLEDLGYCKGLLVVNSCACGEVSIFNEDDFEISCKNLKEKMEDEGYDENGNPFVIASVTCLDCGFIVRLYQTAYVENCYYTSVYEYTFIDRDGNVYLKATTTYGYERHNYESVALGLTDLGCCTDVYVHQCSECGHIRNIIDFKGECRFNQTSSEYIDADGNLRQSVTLSCAKCGLMIYAEQWNVYTSICEYTNHQSYDIYVGGQLVNSFEYSERYLSHEFEESYILNGDSCDDGYRLVRTCKHCGLTDSYNTSGHSTVYEAYDASEFGLCGGYIARYYCIICDETVNMEIGDLYCEWEYIYTTEEGVEVSRCANCGSERHLQYIEGEKDENCFYTATYVDKIYKNGTLIIDATREEHNTKHNFETSYEFFGEGCADGYRVTETCLDCGNYRYYEADGHMMEYEVIKLSGYGICEGDIWYYICKVCGYTEGAMMNLGCSFDSYEYDEEAQTHKYHCMVCDTTMFVTPSEAVKDGCTTKTAITYSFTRGGEELVSFTRYETTTTHKFVYTYIFDGEEDCTQGVTIYYSCTECGYSENYRSFDHGMFDIYALSNSDICSHHYAYYRSCPCGQETSYNFNIDGLVPDEDELGYHCPDCSFALRASQDVVEDGCTVIVNIAIDVYVNGAIDYTFIDRNVSTSHDYITNASVGADGSITLDTQCQKCGLSTHIETSTAVLEEHDGRYYYDLVFTPDVSGEYFIYSITDSDTCVRLYALLDDGNLEEIGYNDDYYGLDFGLSYYLESGRTYIYRISYLSEYYAGSINYILVQSDEIIRCNHSFAETKIKPDGFDSCSDGIFYINSCQCGYINELRVSYDHIYEEREYINLSDHGACYGYIQITECACGEYKEINYDFCGVHSDHSYTDENGVYHAVHHYDCDTCGLHVAIEHTESQEGCVIYLETAITCRIGDTFICSESIIKPWSETHNYSVSFQLYGNDCDSGYLATYTCINCGYQYSAEGYGHNTNRFDFSTTDLGLCDGYGYKYVCTICGYIDSIRIQKLKCKFQLISSENNTNVYKCGTCGAEKTETTVYNSEENSCYLEYVTTETISYGGTVLSVRESYGGKSNHDCEYYFQFDDPENPTCENGVVVIQICKKCGQQFEDHYIGHATIKVFSADFKQYGCCDKHYAIIEDCPCGSNKNIIFDMENLISSEDGSIYHCPDCTYSVTFDRAEETVGCTHTVTYTYSINFGDESVYSYSTIEESVNHSYDLGYRYNDDGSLTVFNRCEGCGDFIGTTTDVADITAHDDGYYFELIITPEETTRYLIYSASEHDAYVDIYTVLEDGTYSHYYSNDNYNGFNFRVRRNFYAGTTYVIRIYTHEHRELKVPFVITTDATVLNCGHGYDIKYITPEDFTSCEDGYVEVALCSCGYIPVFNKSTSHNSNQTDRVYLGNLGACGGEIVYEECLCGYYQRSYFSGYNCSFIYDYTEEELVPGCINRVTIQTCSSCQLTYRSEQIYEMDENCTIWFVRKETVTLGDTVYEIVNERTLYEFKHSFDQNFTIGEDGSFTIGRNCTVCGLDATVVVNVTGEMVYNEELGMNCYDITVTPDETKTYHIYDVIRAGYTYANLYKVHPDGTLELLHASDDYYSNFNFEYELEAGETYVYRLYSRYYYDSIKYVLTSDDRISSCEGHYHTSETIYAEGFETCKDGFVQLSICSCGHINSFNYYTNHDKVNVGSIPLRDHGGCYGWIEFYECRCGADKNYNYYGNCSFTYETTTYVDENGIEHTINTRTCANCGIVYVEDRYFIKEICTTYRVQIVTISIGEDLLVDGYETKRAQSTEHSYEMTFELLGDDCEDGYREIHTCSVCGETYESTYYSHNTYVVEEYIFADYGACENAGNVTRYSCACGKNSYSNIYLGSCTMSYNSDQYVDDEGIYHSVDIRECSECGLRYEHDYYYGYEGCLYYNYHNYSFSIGDLEIVDFTNKNNVGDRHKYTYEFIFDDEDNKSCESGYTVIRTCTECGYTYEEWGNSHSYYPIYDGRFGEYGCCDIHYFRHNSCPCGLNNDISFDGYNLRRDYETNIYTCSNCSYAVRESLETIAGEGCREYYVTTYTVYVDGSEIYSCKRRVTRVNHDFDITASIGDNESFTVNMVCRDCGAEVSTASAHSQSYTAILEDHESNGYYYYDFEFIPEISGTYVIESSANVDTYVDLYRVIDGIYSYIAYNDDGGMGNNFRLEYSLNAGETYVYRIRFYNSSNSGEIPFTLSSSVRVEGDAECGYHNYYGSSETVVLASGADSCEDGAFIIGMCNCGFIYDVTLVREHITNISETIDLGKLGACVGSIDIRRCVCGKERSSAWTSGCSFEMTESSSYVDENGITHYFDVYECRYCELSYVREYYDDIVGCHTYHNTIDTIFMDGTELGAVSNRYHAYTNHEYVVEGRLFGEDCSDGLESIHTCVNCGDSYTNTHYGHVNFDLERYDFTDYGLEIGYLSISGCLCGHNSYWSYNGCGHTSQTNSSYVDDLGVEHTVYTYYCNDCQLELVRDIHRELVGCEVFYVGEITLIIGGETIAETGYRNYSGMEHAYIYEYNLLGDSCEDGVRATGTCQRCGSTYSYIYHHHQAVISEIYDLADHGAEYGSYGKAECPCGYYKSYIFTGCSHIVTESTDFVDENRVHHYVYTSTCEECGIEFVVDQHYEKDGCVRFEVGTATLKINGQLVWEYNFGKQSRIIHEFEYEFIFEDTENPSCEAGVTVIERCKSCDHEGRSYYTSHSTFVIERYDFIDYGASRGYIEICACPCGYYSSYNWDSCGHTSGFDSSYIDDSGVHHYLYNYICDDCGINFNRDYHFEQDGCKVFVVGTVRLTINGTIIGSWDHKYYYHDSHTYEETYDFADPENPDCENGVYVTYTCQNCGYSHINYYTHHNANLVQEVDLTEYGACEGTIYIYSCPCEKNKSFNINGCLNNYSYTSNQYVDENGITQHVETRYCNDCGLRYDRTYYYVENDDCTRDVHYTHAASIGHTLISLYKTTSVETIHDYEVTAELIDGATNCEEGVVATYKCRDCGYSYTNHYSWHDVNIEERIDLSTYGAACGGYLTIKSCVCGHSFSYNFNDSECDFDEKAIAGWIENTIYGSQETAEGYSWFDSYYCIYTCSVTYPDQCGFAIRMSRYWMKNDDCSATQYYVFQLGYDESTGEYLDEIVVPTETRTYHNYEQESFTYGYRYTCSDCGSYYEHKDYYNESGYYYKSGQIFVNTLDDGRAKYREHISEYLGYSDSRFGNYHKFTFSKTIYANGDESWSRWDYEYKDYTASFGENSYIYIQHYSNSNGEDYTYEYAYTQYHGYQFTIYDHYTNGSYYRNYDYTYDFTESCIRTTVHTESNGYTNTHTESYHISNNHVTDKSPTCTQLGEYHHECVICHEVTGRYTNQPTAHNWIKIPSGIYYCYDCGLQNENGASGSIVMEDMTNKYGNGENYVLGYWMRTFVQFTPYASVVFNTPVVDPTTGLEMTEMILFGFNPDQFHYESDEYVGIYVSKAYFEELAAATLADWGIEATRDMYDFKITFVPDGADSNFVYGMTFSDLLYETEVDYIIKEDEFFTYYLSEGEHKDFTVMSEETSEWVFESFVNQDSYVELYDSDGNLITGDDDGGENANFRLAYTLEAGVNYTVRVRWLNSSTYGNMAVGFDKQ